MKKTGLNSIKKALITAALSIAAFTAVISSNVRKTMAGGPNTITSIDGVTIEKTDDVTKSKIDKLPEAGENESYFSIDYYEMIYYGILEDENIDPEEFFVGKEYFDFTELYEKLLDYGEIIEVKNGDILDTLGMDVFLGKILTVEGTEGNQYFITGFKTLVNPNTKYEATQIKYEKDGMTGKLIFDEEEGIDYYYVPYPLSLEEYQEYGLNFDGLNFGCETEGSPYFQSEYLNEFKQVHNGDAITLNPNGAVYIIQKIFHDKTFSVTQYGETYEFLCPAGALYIVSEPIDVVYTGFEEVSSIENMKDGEMYVLTEMEFEKNQAMASIPEGNAVLAIDSNQFPDDEGFAELPHKGVSVIQSGKGFDTCTGGGITYLTPGTYGRWETVTVENPAWYYACNGGGVTFVGPFKCYKVDVVIVDEKDAQITYIGGTKEITSADPMQIDIADFTAKVTINGVDFEIPYIEFEDDVIDPCNGDITVTIKLGTIKKDFDIPCKGQVICGKVLDCKKKPLATKIELFKGGTKVDEVSANESGMFAFTDVLPGEYEVKATVGDVTDTRKVTKDEKVINAGTFMFHFGDTETVNENIIEATCVKEGSHDVVTYCMNCKGELSRENIIDPMTEHIWEEDWIIDEESTTEKEGLRHKNCINCDTKKYDKIGKLTPEGKPEVDPYEGIVEKSAEVDQKTVAEAATLNNTTEELVKAEGIFTEEEKQQIEEGVDAKIWIDITKPLEEQATQEVVKLIEECAKKDLNAEKINMELMDISLFKQVGNATKEKISDPKHEIIIELLLSDKLINTNPLIQREYSVIRLHDGLPASLSSKAEFDGKRLKFKTECFSLYAIGYNDIPIELIINPKDVINLKGKGSTSKIEAMVKPEDYKDRDITYKSDNENIATVDENGVVKAVGKGSCKITVTAAGGLLSGTITVNVEIDDPDVPAGNTSPSVILLIGIMLAAAGAAAITLKKKIAEK